MNTLYLKLNNTYFNMNILFALHYLLKLISGQSSNKVSCIGRIHLGDLKILFNSIYSVKCMTSVSTCFKMKF